MIQGQVPSARRCQCATSFDNSRYSSLRRHASFLPPLPASPKASTPFAATTIPPPAKNRCSAAGTLGGEKFAATNCVVSLYNDQHSVAIWFNEDPITPQEVESFQVSSYASGDKGGK